MRLYKKRSLETKEDIRMRKCTYSIGKKRTQEAEERNSENGKRIVLRCDEELRSNKKCE